MNRRTAVISALTAFALLFVGVVYAQAPTTVIVAVPGGGHFAFRNLRPSYASSLLTWTLEGEVINRTNKHWAIVQFDFSVYSGTTKIGVTTLELIDFAKNAVRKLELPPDLLPVEPDASVRYEIQFLSGDYAPELSTSSLTVSVPEGKFLFHNLRLVQIGSRWQLEGEVVNQTAKRWKFVEFTVRVQTTEGVLEGPLLIRDFPLNSARTFEMPEITVGPSADFPLKPIIVFETGSFYAKYVFVMTKPNVSRNLIFEDAIISIRFTIVQEVIGFELRNKSQVPITIDWNRVSYVDTAGKAHRVIHEGVKFIDKDKVQPPAVVPPAARVDDLVFPADYVRYSTDSGWVEDPMFPDGPLARAYKGKTFRVFMPLTVGTVLKNYSFAFRIETVE